MKGDIAGELARRVDDIGRDAWRRRDSSKPLGRHGIVDYLEAQSDTLLGVEVGWKDRAESCRMSRQRKAG